jgi:hypothetical protein
MLSWPAAVRNQVRIATVTARLARIAWSTQIRCRQQPAAVTAAVLHHPSRPGTTLEAINQENFHARHCLAARCAHHRDHPVHAAVLSMNWKQARNRRGVRSIGKIGGDVPT